MALEHQRRALRQIKESVKRDLERTYVVGRAAAQECPRAVGSDRATWWYRRPPPLGRFAHIGPHRHWRGDAGFDALQQRRLGKEKNEA